MREQIGIRAERKFRALVDEAWVKKAVRYVLKAEGIASPYEVSLVFTDSKTVRALNREYRGVDEITDVLAFYMLPAKGNDPSFAIPPDGITRLGEVIVSCPQAAQQGKEQGHSTDRELALLVIHGILHLLGYDHEEPDQERKMRDRERAYLERLSPVR